MRIIISSLFLLTIFCHVTAQVEEANFVCIRPIETPPQFPGGQEALTAFLHSKMHTPAICEAIQGTIILQFLIDSTGYPKELNIIRSVHPCFAPMINDIWAAMPCWTPGEILGRPRDFWYTIPIRIGKK